MDKIGDKFQEKTKYYPNKIPKTTDVSSKPDLYKEYPDSEKIELDHSDLEIKVSFNEVLQNRQSIRKFTREPLSLEKLSFLLWASTGISHREHGYEFRTAPSAGALYPIETYVVANNINNLEKGVYHYSIKNHQLEQLKIGDYRKESTKAAMNQTKCSYAAVVFIWTAVFNRVKYKYRQRAYRYIYLDAGHIAENLALASTVLDLGSCQIGALFDEKVNDILNVDGKKESAVYMSVVGNPK